MGDVYFAVRRGLGRFHKPVALKVLNSAYAENKDVRAMFIQEAEIAAALSHPNVVQVFDAGIDDERLFIAMEWVQGISLSTLVAALRGQGECLSDSLLAFVGREISAGLQHLHDLKGNDGEPLSLVHRDVTPQNILISIDGRVKLSDFGIAKGRAAATHTRPGDVKGTLEFVAPEQIFTRRADSRTDVYGTAISLVTACVGESVFWRGNVHDTLAAIGRDALPDLTVLRPDLSKAFAEVLGQGAHKEPDARYSTARAFGEALGPFVAASAQAELASLVETFYRGPKVPRLSVARPKGLSRTPEVARPPSARSAPRPFWPAVLAAFVSLSAPVLEQAT
jgi:eukaryotic-like serine/threonine-protein kinase